MSAAASNVPSVKAAQKPFRPSRTARGPVSPARARSAASTPLWAAMPPWARQTSLPSLSDSDSPDAKLPATPSASAMPSADMPKSLAAMAAAPNTPQVAVGW